MNETLLRNLLYFAGGGQIFIALMYQWVRRILDWDAGIEQMPQKLNRQIAHTYSRYIQGLNFAFGVITIFFADAFINDHQLGTALALLLTIYWGVRLLISLFHYDVGPIIAQRPLFRIGNVGFSLLFGVLAAIYALVVANALW